jgi:hypothetical protein
MLMLLVAASCKSPVDLVTNTNPVYSHSHARQVDWIDNCTVEQMTDQMSASKLATGEDSPEEPTHAGQSQIS